MDECKSIEWRQETKIFYEMSATTVQCYSPRQGSYRVFFLTGPPHFQYRKEKRILANQSCCYMRFFIKESVWLARWPIFFLVLNRGGPVKKNTLYVLI